MQQQKYLLFYLKTGGGHLAPARSIAKYINGKYNASISTVLVDGFEGTNHLIRYSVEDGYRILQADAKWYYELLYATNKFRPLAELNCRIITIFTKNFIKKVIQREKATKIIVLHFFLIEPVYEAISELNLDIPVYTIVTDPFTAHPMWFLTRKQNFIVFSNRLKNKIVSDLPESKINVFPFVLDEKFSKEISADAIPSLKQQYGFPPDKKVVLILGGGDGIPHGRKILEALMEYGIASPVAIVCGKNKKLYASVEEIKKRYPQYQVFNYGFVDFVYELLNISDIVITKCGASTMMEILMQKKVPVVNDFIWEQEKGNMEFIRDNKLGIYEPEIKKIPGSIEKLLTDEKEYNFYRDNIISMGLRNGTAEVAEFLVQN